MRNAIGVVHQVLKSSPRFGAPQTQRGNLFGLVHELHLGETHLVDHALHPHVVAVTGIATTDHTEAVLRQAHDRQIRVNAARAVEEVRVHALANRRVGTDLGHRAKLE